jgi:hypothetical protein
VNDFDGDYAGLLRVANFGQEMVASLVVGNWTPILRVLNAGITERIVSEARDNSNARVWEDAEGRLRERNGAIEKRQ